MLLTCHLSLSPCSRCKAACHDYQQNLFHIIVYVYWLLFIIYLSEQFLDVTLGQDAEDGLAVGSVVDIGAGKEFIYQVLHLAIA